MERIITEFEEQIIRLIHHDFGCLTQQEAAERLNVSQAQVSRAVSQLKVKAPQLFPILTQQQAVIRDCIAEWGYTHQDVAQLLDISTSTVDSIITAMRTKGISFEKPRKTVRYENWVDKDIKQKF